MLYKYLSPERSAFFRKPLLRLTQPFVLNDIEEGKLDFVFDADTEVRGFIERNIEKLKASDKSQEIFRLLDSGYLHKKLLDDPSWLLNIAVEKTKKVVNRTLGVLSLTESPLNTTMWPYYAADYKGFVVGFDEKHSFFKPMENELQGCGVLRKIRYTDDVPEVDVSEYNLPKDFLFTKSLQWKHEKEVRMLRMLENADEQKDNVYLFRIPEQAIREVYIGYNVEIKHKDEILNLIKSTPDLNHVSVFMIEKSGFELVKNQII